MHKFKIANLKCMSCVHNISDALKDFDQNIEVRADIPEKVIEVRSEHPEKQLTKLIQDAGYVVEGIKA